MNVTCPNCGKQFADVEELAGRLVACDNCRGQFTVPDIRQADAGDRTDAQPAPQVAGQVARRVDRRGRIARFLTRRRTAREIALVICSGGPDSLHDWGSF